VNLILDNNEGEMSLPSSFFQNYTSIGWWKLQVVLSVNNIFEGTSSMIYKINSLPRDGHCNVTLNNGTSLDTFFYIICMNWIDLDGNITNYEFYGI
jgi:hypothetical protein